MTKRSRDTGGYAFPYAGDAPAEYGMFLRDWLAGQALNGVIRQCSEDTRPDGSTLAQYFAIRAYKVADAMLAERVKP